MKFKSLFLSLCLFSFQGFAGQPQGYEDVIDQNTLEILTPSLASRQTAKIRLDNGLEALLISDPEATQSAAALAMEAGSWSNPDEYPGMAHFTEHLLFMASETYPEENGYFKQVTNNGGMLNAYTAADRTVYMFTVNHDAFPATLDYFSHMFIDPLFSPSGIGRELHAVDQEHDKNIENDAFREYMVIKDSGNPHHPNAQFATGNAETLGGIPRDAVVQWYRENYSSDKAHLVIYASLPIEELKQLAVAHFSAVPMTASAKPRFDAPLTLPPQEGTLTYITPVKDVRELTVFWELPHSFFTDLEDHSDAVLSYILQSRHQDSLYSKLKSEELIDALYAGIAPFSKANGFFAIEFVLTPKGVTHYDRVLHHLYETLGTLRAKEIPSYIFEEVKNMAQIDYAYQGREHPFNFVMATADQMTLEPLETFPQLSILPTHYDPEKCAALIHHLDPKRGLYTLKALPQLTGVEGEKVERWTGAQYAIQPMDVEQLSAWAQPRATHEEVYPTQNPYIPSDLRLVTQKREAEETPIPKLLMNNNYGKMYYWEDGRYLVPEISYIIGLKSPLIDRTPENLVLMALFEKCLRDALKPTTYYASAASLSASVGTNDFSFIISLNGFSEKAPVLLDEVLNQIKTCSWTPEEFELQRSLLISNYENFRKAPPLSQGGELLNHVLFDIYPRVKEYLVALENASYDDFLYFQKKLFEKAYAEMMLTGNHTEDDAYHIWNQVQDLLQYQPYSKVDHGQRNCLVLSPLQGPYKLFEKSESLGHAAILAIQEGPFSFERNATSAILAKGLSEDFFATLRTKQQTAYITQSMKIDVEGQLMQFFLVQSSTHQPDELIARFELFLESYVKDFESMIPEGQFENLRSTLITTAKQPPNNLGEMANRLYDFAFTYHGDFTRLEKKIAALTSLDYETFKEDSIAFLSRSNSRRIAIMLEGYPPQGKGFRYQNITADELRTEGAYLTWSE